MGLAVMGNVVGSGQEYVEQNLLRFINTRSLKPYFNVSTSYVLHKLQLLLFPWRHKPWSRQLRRNEVSAAMEGYKPPREDINAPDLYIPGKPSSTFFASVLTDSHGVRDVYSIVSVSFRYTGPL